MDDERMEYHSRGKLLLTGEYLVLHGAIALAVPTVPGQKLTLTVSIGGGMLDWETRIQGETWLTMKLDPDSYEVLESDPEDRAAFPVHLLREAAELNGSSDWMKGKRALAEVEFDIRWGLGSSSSLISNIAYWAGVDPYQLLRRVSQGSGYDIAAARSDGPLLYDRRSHAPEHTRIVFNPPYLDRIGFAWLGHKQDTGKSVRSFLENATFRQEDIDRVSELGRHLVSAGDLAAVEEIITEHEDIMADILDREPVGSALFPDFEGTVKSLGSWGGDFIMFTAPSGWGKASGYFRGKGLETVLRYKEIIYDAQWNGKSG